MDTLAPRTKSLKGNSVKCVLLGYFYFSIIKSMWRKAKQSCDVHRLEASLCQLSTTRSSSGEMGEEVEEEKKKEIGSWQLHKQTPLPLDGLGPSSTQTALFERWRLRGCRWKFTSALHLQRPAPMILIRWRIVMHGDTNLKLHRSNPASDWSPRLSGGRRALDVLP